MGGGFLEGGEGDGVGDVLDEAGGGGGDDDGVGAQGEFEVGLEEDGVEDFEELEGEGLLAQVVAGFYDVGADGERGEVGEGGEGFQALGLEERGLGGGVQREVGGLVGRGGEGGL